MSLPSEDKHNGIQRPKLRTSTKEAPEEAVTNGDSHRGEEARAMERPPTKRSHLKLFERIRIIRSFEESGYTKSVRALSKEFNLSKSAVAEILRKRNLYREQYEAFGGEAAEASKRSYLRLGDKMRIIQSHENAGKSVNSLSKEYRIMESLGKRNTYAQQQEAVASSKVHIRRSHLCLDDKVQIIRAHHESGGKSVRALSEEFKVSKSAVAEILKKRHLYLRQYEVSDPDLLARRQMAQRDYLATLVWQWYQAAMTRKVRVTMPLLKELAQTYGDALGMEGFDANDEWLECFIRSRRIKQSVFEGSGEDVAFIKRWKMNLPDLVGAYEAKDVFVCDETALLYSILPSMNLTGEALQSLDRWTVLLCCSAMGEKVRPFVITSSNDSCPKDISIAVCHSKQARMTCDLFTEFLNNLNEDMKTQGRNILLFADTSYCHKGCSRSLPNIHIELFPPEVASFVQPLDLGIVRLFKTRYRTELLHYTIAAMRRLQTSKVLPQQALWWVSTAWKLVPEDAIRRCFNEAGFPVACTEFYLTSDALDIELSQLSDLFDCSKEWAGVAPHEYVTFDNTLETDTGECVPAQISGESEGLQMTYEEMLATVERLQGFAEAREPEMVAAVKELKNVAERAFLRQFTNKENLAVRIKQEFSLN